MGKLFLVCAATVAMLASVREAGAAIVPLYSFEAASDGFFGLGAAVSEESSIGVTEGSKSLKYLAGGGGFVGARTETVIPAALNNPPGVVRILFDLTIVDSFTGGFADLGVTIFGHAMNDPGGPVFGIQVQFSDVLAMGALAPGTYLDQEIVLDAGTGPYGSGSFNELFGTGPNDITVTSAFQFFMSKSGGIPFTIYLDNVRLDDGDTSGVPEPASLSMLGLGVAALALFRKRLIRR